MKDASSVRSSRWSCQPFGGRRNDRVAGSVDRTELGAPDDVHDRAAGQRHVQPEPDSETAYTEPAESARWSGSWTPHVTVMRWVVGIRSSLMVRGAAVCRG